MLTFFSSSPTTTLAYIAARTERLQLSTATTLITTNDPVKIAEDYAMLQHLTGGRVDLVMGRGNTGPVYPWFGQDIRKGIELAIENYDLLRRLWTEDVVNWEGQFRTPLQQFTSTPRPLDGVAPLGQGGDEVAAHQAEPAAVDRDLVGRIHGGDGILHVHDGREGGFQHHVGDAGGVGATDRARPVDDDLDVQAVVAQQQRGRVRGLAREAHETLGTGERRLVAALQLRDQHLVRHAVRHDLPVAALRERRRAVEEFARAGDYLGAARLVVAARAGRPAILGDRVGAVERVVE